MAFDAKIFRVLVASPGDVGNERDVIPDVINDWNAINAMISKVVLMPIKWETHSAPLMGDRPQAIINKQLVEDCDVLVGVFWTRIGTNTGIAVSGTVEEIEQFLKLKKPVMLYFSQSPIEPDKIDITQFTVLKNFKEKMRLEGLTESYNGIPDFRQKFTRQFSINISNLINNALENKIEEAKPQSLPAKNKNSEETIIIPATINRIEISKEILTNEKVDEYLLKAVQSSANPNGWARIAAVGSYLHTYTPVDYRDFHFPKLQAFLKSRKLFEFKDEKGHPILRVVPK
ncbi:OST-HTH/LOTUS domain-containing protein [Mucilaginibacter gracilis]|uniref:OST-HTH/LOTUS domain-containing protein n=1 Tax=Mucilaginibacter gracilis TaxID=423350 RepID=A0A495IXA2_9SPHI|nr:OST-HTH/LOTUS domain-containing protein [Mucilaginibacter gracilis]RKR81310.1 OST-HTH/LOTUS domain-containing protein [Mucilaginibacter gracilis]